MPVARPSLGLRPQQVAQHQARFDGAHRAWLQEVVTQVLPRRVAACERALRAMGFATPPPHHPKPKPRNAGSVLSGAPKEDEAEAEAAADLNAALPPLPLGLHWSSADVARAVAAQLLPSPASSRPADEGPRRVAAALQRVGCHGAAV